MRSSWATIRTGFFLPGRAWSRFWFVSGPPEALALCRAGFGLFALLRWLELAPHVDLLFSRNGLLMPLFELPGGDPSPAVAWLLFIGAVLAAAAIAAGFLTRLALVAHLLLFSYHYVLYFHTVGFSYDPLYLWIPLCLLPGPCGETLSLDAWRARRAGDGRQRRFDVGRPAPTRGATESDGRTVPGDRPLWTQRLLMVQVSLFYLGSGMFKVTADSWDNGDLLYFTLQDFWASELAFWFVGLDWPAGVYDLLLLSVILFELTLPFLLWSRRWQWLAMAGGVAFHGSILVLLNIWQFMVVIPAYVLFFEPAEVARVLAGARRRILRVMTRQASRSVADGGPPLPESSRQPPPHAEPHHGG